MCTYISPYPAKCKHTGWVSFRGAEVSCPNIVFHCLHENQMVCPNITWFFCPKMAIWKILGGLQPPSAPWAVRLWMYMYVLMLASILPYIQNDRHVNIQNPASSKRWIQFQVDFGLCLLNSRFLHKSPNASYHLKNAGVWLGGQYYPWFAGDYTRDYLA